MSTELLAKEGRYEKGNLVLEGVPGSAPVWLQESLLSYQNTRGARCFGWVWESPTETNGILIGTRFGETIQIHHVQFITSRSFGEKKRMAKFLVLGAKGHGDEKAIDVLSRSS